MIAKFIMMFSHLVYVIMLIQILFENRIQQCYCQGKLVLFSVMQIEALDKQTYLIL